MTTQADARPLRRQPRGDVEHWPLAADAWPTARLAGHIAARSSASGRHGYDRTTADVDGVLLTVGAAPASNERVLAAASPGAVLVVQTLRRWAGAPTRLQVETWANCGPGAWRQTSCLSWLVAP